MPSALLEHQHELTTEDGSVSLVFGTQDTTYLTTSHPVITGSDGPNGDVARVREDGMALGEDFLAGKTVAFEISVLTDRADNPAQAGSDALNALEGLWRNRELRNRATKYAILRSCIGGRTRRAYGRPRRYDEVAGNMTNRGITPVVCDFTVPDATWYDDEETELSIPLAASTGSGLTSPLVTPLVTSSVSATTAALTSGGSKPTWPVVTFHGPCADPRVRFNTGLVIALTETIAAGESITVDPRPWQRVVTQTSDGANKAGSLTYDTPPMRQMFLDPGTYEVIYTATDSSGSSWCSVKWRNAYARW